MHRESREFKVLIGGGAGGGSGGIVKKIDALIDRLFINRTADSVNDGKISREEGRKKVEEHTTARVNELVIAPERQRLSADSRAAAEKLPSKVKEKKEHVRQRRETPSKLVRTVTASPVEKEPWTPSAAFTAALFFLASIAMMVWGVVNTRNMAISSFPIFAANPGFAWGVGGVIALLVLFIEMVPTFFGLGQRGKKFYFGTVGAVTAFAAVVWVGLFAKSAGLLGHGGGISVDLESVLAPEASFLGLSPEQQDLWITVAQFALEFLLPALMLANVHRIVRSHGKNPPLVTVEENPEYRRLTTRIDQLSSEISELKKRIKAPARFERQVGDIMRQYVLLAESYFLECCGLKAEVNPGY